MLNVKCFIYPCACLFSLYCCFVKCTLFLGDTIRYINLYSVFPEMPMTRRVKTDRLIVSYLSYNNNPDIYALYLVGNSKIETIAQRYHSIYYVAYRIRQLVLRASIMVETPDLKISIYNAIIQYVHYLSSGFYEPIAANT